MTYPTHYAGPLPVPRIWHCRAGSTITLSGDARPRTIDYIQGRHAVMSDGLIVTLCHPVDPGRMKFGEGGCAQEQGGSDVTP